MYKKTALVFGGQGTQYPGMCREIYNPTVKNIYKQTRKGVGPVAWWLASNRLLEKIKIPKSKFSVQDWILAHIVYSQIAIFACNHAFYKSLMERLPQLEIDMMTGHSFGIYNMAVASEAISYGDAVPLVKKGSQFAQEVSNKVNGGLAVLMLKGNVDLTAELKGLEENGVYVALDNSPTQKIIGGLRDKLEDAVDKIEKLQKFEGSKIFIINGINAPFHTPHMTEAADNLRRHLYMESERMRRINQRLMEVSTYRVVAPSSAELIVDPRRILDETVESICKPVKWVETIERMTEDFDVTRYIVVGPDKKGRIPSIIRQIHPDENEVEILIVNDQGSLDRVVEQLSNG